MPTTDTAAAGATKFLSAPFWGFIDDISYSLNTTILIEIEVDDKSEEIEINDEVIEISI